MDTGSNGRTYNSSSQRIPINQQGDALPRNAIWKTRVKFIL